MPELRSYLKHDVPRDIAVQIASYVRVQWPNAAGTRPPLWEGMSYPADCLHFVLSDGDVLISHAAVGRRTLEYGGRTFNVFGLSSVFCYPTHRGRGFGEQVVAAATDHIRRQRDADFALLFCGDRVRSLYLRHGWEDVPSLRVTFGDDRRLFNDGHLMTLFVSDTARAIDFSAAPLHVGPRTW